MRDEYMMALLSAQRMRGRASAMDDGREALALLRQAEKSLKQALAVRPDGMEAHTAYAEVLLHMALRAADHPKARDGYLRRAFDHLEQAVRAEPTAEAAVAVWTLVLEAASGVDLEPELRRRECLHAAETCRELAAQGPVADAMRLLWATARLGPWAISLAIIGSYHGLISSPARTPLSARTSAGKARCDSRPVAGRKPFGTSSA